MPKYTNKADEINKHALQLLRLCRVDFIDIRGIGISMSKLLSTDQIGSLQPTNPIKELFSKHKSPLKRQMPTSQLRYDDAIDQSILELMPLDIQKEFANSPKKIRRSDDIDLSVLAELPPDLQREIEENMSVYKTRHLAIASSSKYANEIIPASQLISGSQIDEQVFQQLDDKSRREIMAQMRINQGKARSSEPKFSAHQPIIVIDDSSGCGEDVNEMPLPLHTLEKPKFRGSSDLKTVLYSLDAWISSPLVQYSSLGNSTKRLDPPLQSDVDEILTFLLDLVGSLNLKDAHIIVSRLLRVQKIFNEGEDVEFFGSWIAVVDIIKTNVDGRVKELYSSRLRYRLE